MQFRFVLYLSIILAVVSSPRNGLAKKDADMPRTIRSSNRNSGDSREDHGRLPWFPDSIKAPVYYPRHDVSVVVKNKDGSCTKYGKVGNDLKIQCADLENYLQPIFVYEGTKCNFFYQHDYFEAFPGLCETANGIIDFDDRTCTVKRYSGRTQRPGLYETCKRRWDEGKDVASSEKQAYVVRFDISHHLLNGECLQTLIVQGLRAPRKSRRLARCEVILPYSAEDKVGRLNNCYIVVNGSSVIPCENVTSKMISGKDVPTLEEVRSTIENYDKRRRMPGVKSLQTNAQVVPAVLGHKPANSAGRKQSYFPHDPNVQVVVPFYKIDEEVLVDKITHEQSDISRYNSGQRSVKVLVLPLCNLERRKYAKIIDQHVPCTQCKSVQRHGKLEKMPWNNATDFIRQYELSLEPRDVAMYDVTTEGMWIETDDCSQYGLCTYCPKKIAHMMNDLAQLTIKMNSQAGDSSPIVPHLQEIPRR